MLFLLLLPVAKGENCTWLSRTAIGFEADIYATDVPDAECCDAQRSLFLHYVAQTVQKWAVDDSDGPYSDWNGVKSLMGISECTVPAQFGGASGCAGNDADMSDVANDATVQKLRDYVCGKWNSCNTLAGLTATGSTVTDMLWGKIADPSQPDCPGKVVDINQVCYSGDKDFKITDPLFVLHYALGCCELSDDSCDDYCQEAPCPTPSPTPAPTSSSPSYSLVWFLALVCGSTC